MDGILCLLRSCITAIRLEQSAREGDLSGDLGPVNKWGGISHRASCAGFESHVTRFLMAAVIY